MTPPDAGRVEHETPTHRTEQWVFDATDGICPTCLQEALTTHAETIRRLGGMQSALLSENSTLKEELEDMDRRRQINKDVVETQRETIRRLEAQVAALQEDLAELTAAMAEAEPRLMAEHAAVLAAIPFVNRCRNWWDGTDLYIPRSGLLATEKDTGDLLRAAARALDATRGFLPIP